MELLAKPDPVVVSVCEEEPAACCVGDIEVREGTGLLLTGPPPPPPPQLGRVTNRKNMNASSAARHGGDGIAIRQIPSRGRASQWPSALSCGSHAKPGVTAQAGWW